MLKIENLYFFDRDDLFFDEMDRPIEKIKILHFDVRFFRHVGGGRPMSRGDIIIFIDDNEMFKYLINQEMDRYEREIIRPFSELGERICGLYRNALKNKKFSFKWFRMKNKTPETETNISSEISTGKTLIDARHFKILSSPNKFFSLQNFETEFTGKWIMATLTGDLLIKFTAWGMALWLVWKRIIV